MASMRASETHEQTLRRQEQDRICTASMSRGGYRGGSLGAEEPPSGKIHYKLSRGGFRGGGGGGFGGYHQPLSSLYMLDSVCQTPL